MTDFALEHTGDYDATGRNFDRLGATLTELFEFVSWGNGVPAHTPLSRQIYINLAGGAGTTLYVYEGAGWVGK